MKVARGRLEHKLVGAALGHVVDVGELDDTVGGILVALILGVEPETLSGLAGVRGDSLGRVRLVLEVSLQVLLGDGLVLEVEETLELEETGIVVSLADLQ